ncbi:hypothetical protein BH09ACT8_BH09ACT8_21160 [soil metagenome]
MSTSPRPEASPPVGPIAAIGSGSCQELSSSPWTPWRHRPSPSSRAITTAALAAARRGNHHERSVTGGPRPLCGSAGVDTNVPHLPIRVANRSAMEGLRPQTESGDHLVTWLAPRVGAPGVEWLKRGLQSRKLLCPDRFPSRNPATLSATGSPAPATANSTAASMSWPSHKFGSTPQAGPNCLRKRTDGKGHKEAMRCLKRRPSDVVYRQLRSDANRLEAGPGGHSGAALESSAASSNPAD